MQGVDLNKIRGGKQGQQRVAQAVAMESANRVLTRRALDVLKSIATGEYRAEMAKADMISEGGPVPPSDNAEAAPEMESTPAADEAEVPSEENSPETESKSE
jgi:hypothetical protein